MGQTRGRHSPHPLVSPSVGQSDPEELIPMLGTCFAWMWAQAATEHGRTAGFMCCARGRSKRGQSSRSWPGKWGWGEHPACLSSVLWPQPTPVLREMELLPATARARTCSEQNNSCFPGSPGRTQCTSRGPWGWAGSWDGGQTAPVLLQLLPEQETIGDRPWLQPCVPGMGVWLC